ncbi:MAG: divalent-cation tolerance protein CutA [Candidatus Palauibacterales bacterium]|nr:divalent-cation tolerance protein CutA [Candidatus Palauibacterales bacterium]MDP2528191.1 divalent-cation tolerance protein CutA [Candidatus Palauibacterales bacterium]MDP2584851.1 divalent-cation tolerance protein CutA [Candidatus Palauibacterales bacterium]
MGSREPFRGGARGPAPAPGVCVVFVTGPDRDVLLALGRTLVEERLAACASVLGGVRSVFRWGAAVEEAEEALAILKTTRARLEELTVRIRALHSYDEPEVVAVPAAGGSASYLAWVAGAVADG